MQAVILAGGAGTRLRSIVDDTPKSMARFAEKPFLEYQIDCLREYGFTQVILCVGYLNEHIERHFGDGQRWNLSISYSRESQPLGTGGAVRNARAQLRGSFLLLNGDSFVELNLREFAEAHRERRSCDTSVAGTVALTRVDDASDYGAVEMDSDHRVVNYREKSASAAQWISAGIYALEPAIFDSWPSGRALSLEHEVLPGAMQNGGSVFGHPSNGFFVDIGTPKGYRAFRDYIEGGDNGHSQ